MPSTTNIVLSTPAHGSETDTWDVPLNANANILDTCFGSVTTKALTNANVTLSATEARVSVLRFTGTLTGNVIINVSAIRKSWICENYCLGLFTIVVSGGSGNVVALPPGSSMVYWDGTNTGFMNLGMVGEYWDFSGASVPSWVSSSTVPPYLNCDGSTFSAVTYPLLNQILGTTTLPDFRGRSRAFLDGGTGRITTAGSGIDGSTRFSAGGGQTITLVQSNLPNVGLSVSGNLSDGSVTIDNQSTYSFPNTNFGSGFTSVGSFGGSSLGLSGHLNNTALTGSTSSINGGVGQTASNNMQPTAIGGITMIRAA